jgi:hypothetical protein
MPQNMTTDGVQALADLDELCRLAASEPDLLEPLCRLIDEGTSILQIDRSRAPHASDSVVRYKLADEVHAVLAAVRARDVDPNEVVGSASAGAHIGSPC